MSEKYKEINLIYDCTKLDIKEFRADFEKNFDVKEFTVKKQKDGNYIIHVLYKNKEKKSNAGRKKKVADKNFETIIKLHNDGWSYEKIAQFYGITRNTLYNNLRKYKALNNAENEENKPTE